MSRDFFEENAVSRYDEILADFKNLALSRFKWSNLPTGLTSDRLETMLMERGQVLCFKRGNTESSITILPCFPTNKLTTYGEYDKYEVIAYNGECDTINIENAVRLKNNPVASNNIDNLMKYAKRIDDIEMTQDVNLFQQNVPKIILTDEGGRLTAKSLIKAIKDFKFVIFGKKSLSSQLSTSDVLDTSSPFLLDKLQDHKNNLINEVLSSLGINNNNTDKKERLVVDEVNANNDFIDDMLDLMYTQRLDFCVEVKTMFGKEIKVEKRGGKNGNVHNDNRGNSGK